MECWKSRFYRDHPERSCYILGKCHRMPPGTLHIAIETIARELCDRDHQQIVLLAESDKVRQTSHGAVVIDDLADHSGGLQAGETRQIDGRFRLAAPFENATGPSAKWENVAWSREVFWMTVRVNNHLDCLRAVVS